MSRSPLVLIGIAGTIAVVSAACSASTTTSGAGGASSTTSASTGTTSTPASSSSGKGGDDITVGVGGSSGTSTIGCENPPDVDMDGDGWTGADGDCNDCDKNVNPGAIEVKVTVPQGDAGLPDPADEDCDGMIDNVPLACDDGLALNDVDPKDAAKAIDLCQTTEEAPAKKKDLKWGVIQSSYVGADGASPRAPGLQVGLQSNFGPNVTTRLGKAMLGLSSGHMRVPGQSGVCEVNNVPAQSCVTPNNGPPPPNFPAAVPGCPPKPDIHDDIAFQVKVRAPTNATGYKFNFKFYSYEYPEWVCSDYNDQFVALVSPAPMGALNGNISFDSTNHPVSVNVAFFDVCDPAKVADYGKLSGTSPMAPMPYCPSGTGELIGTGMLGGPGDPGDGGGTSWLQTTAPVEGGTIVTIRFAIWDTGDHNLDSSVLIDAFQWIANGGTVKVETKPPA